MTREWRSLKSPGAFLQSRYSKPTDLKLISQVEFWSISRRVFEKFGADTETTIAKQRSVEIKHLSDAYDRWRQDWLEVLALNNEPGCISQRLFDIYFHSGKLYLFSHVFRGSGSSHAPSSAGSEEIDDLTHAAFENAVSMIRCIIDGEENYLWVGKLPFYFWTMIAFASVCIIKTSFQGRPLDHSRTNETLDCLHRLAKVLRISSVNDSPTRPLLSIAKSLETATDGWFHSNIGQYGGLNNENSSNIAYNFDLLANDYLDMNFLGGEDSWMLCPDETIHPVF